MANELDINEYATDIQTLYNHVQENPEGLEKIKSNAEKQKEPFKTIANIAIKLSGEKGTKFLEAKGIDRDSLKDMPQDQFAKLIEEFNSFEFTKEEPAKEKQGSENKSLNISEEINEEPAAVKREKEQWEKEYEKAYKATAGKDNVETTLTPKGVTFDIKKDQEVYKIEHKDQNNVALSKETPQELVDTMVKTAHGQGITDVNISKAASDEFKAKMSIAAVRAGSEILNQETLTIDESKLTPATLKAYKEEVAKKKELSEKGKETKFEPEVMDEIRNIRAMLEQKRRDAHPELKTKDELRKIPTPSLTKEEMLSLEKDDGTKIFNEDKLSQREEKLKTRNEKILQKGKQSER